VTARPQGTIGSRVPVHDLDSAPEPSRRPLANRADPEGRVHSIFGAMADSPALINVYDMMESHLAAHSRLGDATRQAIVLTVAAVNDCDYDQAASTAAAMAAGFTVEETIAIRRGAIPDRPQLQSLVAFARQIADNRGCVDDSVWSDALDAGWSGGELLDAYSDVIRAILINYFNNLAGTELDIPPAP
jgi:AhpD family alkylhydroperoxidase